MRSRTKLFVGIAAAATLALGAAAPIALADGTTQQDISFPAGYTTTNLCNGENVVVSGTLHLTSHFVSDSAGGEEVSYHLNSKDMHGVGDQGNDYAIQVGGITQTHLYPNEAGTSTADLRFESQGSAPNFELHVVFHITLNANEVPTADFYKADATCQG